MLSRAAPSNSTGGRPQIFFIFSLPVTFGPPAVLAAGRFEPASTGFWAFFFTSVAARFTAGFAAATGFFPAALFDCFTVVDAFLIGAAAFLATGFGLAAGLAAGLLAALAAGLLAGFAADALEAAFLGATLEAAGLAFLLITGAFTFLTSAALVGFLAGSFLAVFEGPLAAGFFAVVLTEVLLLAGAELPLGGEVDLALGGTVEDLLGLGGEELRFSEAAGVFFTAYGFSALFLVLGGDLDLTLGGEVEALVALAVASAFLRSAFSSRLRLGASGLAALLSTLGAVTLRLTGADTFLAAVLESAVDLALAGTEAIDLLLLGRVALTAVVDFAILAGFAATAIFLDDIVVLAAAGAPLAGEADFMTLSAVLERPARGSDFFPLAGLALAASAFLAVSFLVGEAARLICSFYYYDFAAAGGASLIA